MSDQPHTAAPVAEELKNPYEHYDGHPDRVLISRRLAGVFLFLFLCLIVLPPVWRNVYDAATPGAWVPAKEFFHHPSPEARAALEGKKAADPRITHTEPDLLHHIHSFEKKLETDSVLARGARRETQLTLARLVREGNRKAFIGKDGWLFFRPAIDALTGYGPLRPEPETVAKDPTRPPWDPPLPAILDFQKQLAEIGVELILVPVPVKPQIYPEMLGASLPVDHLPVNHEDAEAFYGQLRQAGVQVCDLGPAMVKWKEEGVKVFLKQDTHWTPEGMERSAGFVGDFLKQRPWYAALAKVEAPYVLRDLPVSHQGDLVERLDLPKGSTAFQPEQATAHQVIDPATGKPVITQDLESPVVLLGDSFTNIFSLESMGWGSGAGFAQHLTKELGFPLDVIAQNGQASSGSRETLARRPGARQWMKETKKAVVWTIAARDLFLSETPARENDVTWKKVTLSDGERQGLADEEQKPVTVRGQLAFKSKVLDPKQAAYSTSLFATTYEVQEVLEGSYEEQTIKVIHPAFIEKQLTEASAREVGQTFVLRLVPFGQTGQEGLNLSDDVEEFLPPYFEESSPAGGAASSEWNGHGIRVATGVSLGVAFLLGVLSWGITRRVRRA